MQDQFMSLRQICTEYGFSRSFYYEKLKNKGFPAPSHKRKTNQMMRKTENLWLRSTVETWLKKNGYDKKLR